MKKFLKKVMSCAIAFVLVAATAAVLKAAPVKAATSTTLYFKNSQNWAKVYCYMYYGTGDNGPKWPGTEMTNLGNGWYSISYTGTDPIDPVFNDNNGNQTNNCTEMKADGSSIYYWISGTSTNSMTHKTAYSVSVSTDPVKAGYPNVTIYFKNTLNWSNVYCYMFYGSGDNGPKWPGTKMTSLGNGWYSFAYTGTDPIDPVFTDNNGKQTTNCQEMTASNKAIYYVPNGKTTVNSMSKSTSYDLDVFTDAVKAGFKTTAVIPASTSSNGSSSSSKSSAASSASSVSNPKTGNTTPIAAGSVVVLASVAVLGIALAKKKSK